MMRLARAGFPADFLAPIAILTIRCHCQACSHSTRHSGHAKPAGGLAGSLDSTWDWWFQMLAQQGYVIACVDNRGTGARGEEFKKMTYKQLGHYEVIDQIYAATEPGSGEHKLIHL